MRTKFQLGAIVKDDVRYYGKQGIVTAIDDDAYYSYAIEVTFDEDTKETYTARGKYDVMDETSSLEIVSYNVKIGQWGKFFDDENGDCFIAKLTGIDVADENSKYKCENVTPFGFRYFIPLTEQQIKSFEL